METPAVANYSKWLVIAVLGRPSASVRDFFNSIKFTTVEVVASSSSEALRLGDPHFDRLVDSAGGYQVLNWYAFKSDPKSDSDNAAFKQSGIIQEAKRGPEK